MSNEIITTTSGISVLAHEVANTNVYELYTNTLSPNTKMNYISTIKSFFGVAELNQITIQDIQSVTPDVANAWANYQLSIGQSKSTINRKLSAMKSFYQFLCRRNIRIVEYNPFSTEEGSVRFKNTTKNYSDKRTLAPQEITKLLKCVKVDEAQGVDRVIALRDLIILEILVTAGLRRAELCGVKLGDVRLNNGTYLIEVLGKGGKTRFMVLAPSIKRNIDEYLRMRGVSLADKQLPLIISHSSNADPAAHVNTSTVYRVVKKYAMEAGLDESTIAPHVLRHTFATTAHSELGLSKDTLQDLMGHASSATTARYIHANDMVSNSPANALASMYNIE